METKIFNRGGFFTNHNELSLEIKKVQQDFQNNKISKADYIQKMYQYHKLFFFYSELIKNSDIKKIEISDDNVILTSRKYDIKIKCEKNDERIPPIEILNFGTYEEDQFSMIYNLIDDNFSIFDIGANIGWYSLHFAKIRNNTIVYAFEPIEKTFTNLLLNIELNKSQTIKPFNFGLYDKETELTFYYYPEGSGNASSANLAIERDPQTIKCKVTTLDTFANKNKIAKIDFIKCDVEGSELFALKGGNTSIEKWKPIIFAEMLRKWSAKFGYHPNEIIEFLKNKGYLCFITKNQKLEEIKEIDENTIEKNFFFLHREKHSEQISTYS